MRGYLDLSDEEQEIAFDRIMGFRAPGDDRQFAAYAVALAFRLAALSGLTDQDLVDRYVIDFLLGRGSPSFDYRSAIEKAIRRSIGLDEPQPLDDQAIREEQKRRNRQRETEVLFA